MNSPSSHPAAKSTRRIGAPVFMNVVTVFGHRIPASGDSKQMGRSLVGGHTSFISCICRLDGIFMNLLQTSYEHFVHGAVLQYNEYNYA